MSNEIDPREGVSDLSRGIPSATNKTATGVMMEREMQAQRVAVTAHQIADLWRVTERTCDGQHPKFGCDWERVLWVADALNPR